MRIFYVLGFGASYIRDLTVLRNPILDWQAYLSVNPSKAVVVSLGFPILISRWQFQYATIFIVTALEFPPQKKPVIHHSMSQSRFLCWEHKIKTSKLFWASGISFWLARSWTFSHNFLTCPYCCHVAETWVLFQYKDSLFPGEGIPMLKIRWSWDSLIFNMMIPIQVRHLYSIQYKDHLSKKKDCHC